jgi:uncharacterized protein involved in copper resistance
MKRLLLIVGIALGVNASGALAQHEKMPGHENMPQGDHAKHNKKKQGDADKKQDDADKKQGGDANKKPAPK